MNKAAALLWAHPYSNEEQAILHLLEETNFPSSFGCYPELEGKSVDAPLNWQLCFYTAEENLFDHHNISLPWGLWYMEQFW